MVRAAYLIPMTDTTITERISQGFRRAIPRRFRRDIPIVPVVRLSGVIGFSTPLKPGLTISTVARPLERAFAWRNAEAVAIVINSPGARRYSRT